MTLEPPARFGFTALMDSSCGYPTPFACRASALRLWSGPVALWCRAE